MDTWDFKFYRKDIKAKKPITGHLRLFSAFKKSQSDRSKPPKHNTSQKGEARGLVAAISRASNQASQRVNRHLSILSILAFWINGDK